MGKPDICLNLFSPCSQSLADFRAILPLDSIFAFSERPMPDLDSKSGKKQKARRLRHAFQGHFFFLYPIYSE
jgi:hypothetical protein